MNGKPVYMCSGEGCHSCWARWHASDAIRIAYMNMQIDRMQHYNHKEKGIEILIGMELFSNV